MVGGSTPRGGSYVTTGEGSVTEVGRTGRSGVDCADDGEEELAPRSGALFTEYGHRAVQNDALECHTYSRGGCTPWNDGPFHHN